MGKLVYSIRWKLLLLFVSSLLLSIITVALLFAIVLVLSESKSGPIYAMLQFIYRTLGMPISLILMGVLLFIIFTFVLSHRNIRYLSQISESVQQIADGNFDHQIAVYSKDELGELAEHINQMAVRLKTSIEEERRSEQTKNELITSVSHDLRTPLTSILGYLGLIEQDRYRDEVELRHYVHIAYSKSEQLHTLIHDLFEYTRLSGGGITLNRSSINLTDMLTQLADALRVQMAQNGVECRQSFDAPRVTIQGDGDKLARVFENLLTNAMVYGKSGGKIDIAAVYEDGMAVVRIVNYGEAIPVEVQPLLFDRFYRIEQSRSEHTGGSGLGLAIAKQIVEWHNGRIAVLSNEQQTLFEVKLPI